MPSLSSITKKVSNSSLAKKPSASQLASSSTPVPKKPSTTNLKSPPAVVKKNSAPNLNRKVSNSAQTLSLNQASTSPASLRKASSSGGLKSSVPPQTPTTPTTPVATRTSFKPGRQVSTPQTPKATPNAAPKPTPKTVRPSSSSTTTSTDADSPKKPKGNQSQSLRDTIAKARAARAASLQQGSVDATKPGEHDPFDTLDPFNIGTGGTTDLQRKIKTARTEGRLNIAMMELKEIPKQVYEMYDMKNEDDTDDGPKWYENVDLLRIIAADNDIEVIGEELATIFGGLTAIDVSSLLLSPLFFKKKLNWLFSY